MGLILLALIGFLPTYYALDLHHADVARDVYQSAIAIRAELEREKALTPSLRADLDAIAMELEGKSTFFAVSPKSRWRVRSMIFRFRQNLNRANLSPAALQSIAPYREAFSRSIEYVPFWVIIGVAAALGAGTTIGYKRIVVTVAEKIGKTHLTYAQAPRRRSSRQLQSVWLTSPTCRSARLMSCPQVLPARCGRTVRAFRGPRSRRSASRGS